MTTTTTPAAPADEAGTVPDRQLVRSATGLLRTFNQAGVLGPADVHTAHRVADICRRAGGAAPGEQEQLALALTVRALRLGSVCIDLDTIAHSAFDEAEEIIDVSTLPWPEPAAWRAACTSSPLVTDGEDGQGVRPMRMVDGLLYLERYWLQQEQVRTELVRRRSAAPPDVDTGRLSAALDRLFGPVADDAAEPDRQRLAAAVSATRWVTVLAGGPGTGKTTTVARILALIRDLSPDARVALTAPTGKAAARLEEAVRSSAATLPAEDAARLGELAAKTVHRLLGWLPDHRSRFRYNADNHLPYDLVIVDEMSMVSLTLMARLMEAVRPDARLVLVGDPDQLSSVEAGAVMADITGAEVADRAEVRTALAGVGAPGADAPATQGVVRLTRTWRFGARIGALAAAIRSGDADGVVELLTSEQGADRTADDPADRIEFTQVDVGADDEARQQAAVETLRAEVLAAGTRLHHAAGRGDIAASLAALDQHRLLCAHRLGPYGVARWSREVEGWLVDAIPGYAVGDPPGSPWYVGRPVLMNANDYEVQLYNGDTGVAVTTPAGLRVAFARGGDPLVFAPVRLDDVQTVHAMTVHRAQGSQFEQVSLILPPVDSPLLTRELLYTAVTRARRVVRLLGSLEAVRRAVLQPADRASGLRARLG